MKVMRRQLNEGTKGQFDPKSGETAHVSHETEVEIWTKAPPKRRGRGREKGKHRR